MSSRFLPVPLLISSLLLGCSLAAAEDTCLSAGCHATLIEASTVHPAADSCDICHEPVAEEHPQPGKKTFKLAQQPAELCAICHEPSEAKSWIHTPVKEGMCTTCHDPHASNHPKLLPQSERETCLACHDTVITRSMTALHGPITEGQCTACHDPHGSEQPRLLVAGFPQEAYVPYTDTEFTLCFGCHERGLVGEPVTSSATNFRDGERNLHFLHVNDSHKGRSCKLCHDIHGGSNSVLIADSVPFGSWQLPLRFVKTETGGECAPGCHARQRYDRRTPGKRPQG